MTQEKNKKNIYGGSRSLDGRAYLNITASFNICSFHKNSLRNTQLHHDDNMFVLL